MSSRAPRFITARFPGTCPETGKPIRKGDTVVWVPARKAAFHSDSAEATALRAREQSSRANDFARAYHMADANW